MRKVILGCGLCASIISAAVGVHYAYGSEVVTTEASSETSSTTDASTETETEASTDSTVTTEVTMEATTEVKEVTVLKEKSLNNAVKNIDYKLSGDVLKKVYTVDVKEDVTEKETYADLSQNLDNLKTEKAYLINNNIISRRTTITGLSADYHHYTDDVDSFLQSELWMALAKVRFGVVNSRLVSYNIPGSAEKVNDYVLEDGTTATADFSAGTQVLYVSPNVYELYFAKLLDAGLLDKKDFSTSKGKKFIKDYETIASNSTGESKVAWDTTLGVAENPTTSVLGYTTKYKGDAQSFTEKAPAYFRTEELYTIDALKIIEKYMRATEKEMTELEASLVSYKYGINYLNTLSDSDRKTVEYLIAKGVLNYEDQNEMLNIYGVLTRDIAYKLLYRVANKDARFDFSKIQLTDGETFWQSKGFYANSVDVYSVNSIPINRTVSSSELKELVENSKGSHKNSTNNTPTTTEQLDDDFLDDILGLSIYNPIRANAAQKATFKVRKMFDMNYVYKYDGKDISSLSVGGEVFAIDSLTLDNDVYGSSAKVKVVTFEVQAKDYVSALAYVNNKITSDMSSITKNTIDGYTTVENSSGNLVTLVSEGTLKREFTKISILEDKLLVNNETGTEAVLLPDSGYALVGNQVIVSDDLLVTNSSGEIYYNLEVIACLLSNNALNKLTNGEMFICKEIKKEVVADAKTSLGTSLGKCYMSQINKKYTNDTGDTVKKKDWHVNLSQLDKGLNSLIRQYDVKMTDGSLETITFIVDWKFYVLDSNLCSSSDVETQLAANKAAGRGGYTIAEINRLFYTKPSDTNAAAWWDSNLSMSNSLANFMYGTSGVKYISCGYLAPSVTVLKSKNVSDSLVAKIFKNNGFKLSSAGKQYCNNTAKFWESYFNDPKMPNEALINKAKEIRHFTMINSRDQATGKAYGADYYLTNANVLYRNAETDSDELSYSGGVLTIKTRNKTESAGISPGMSFTYAGKEWIYVGHKDGYYKLQPNFTIESKGMISDDYYPVVMTGIAKTGTSILPVKDSWLPEGTKRVDYQETTKDGKTYYKMSGKVARDVVEQLKNQIKTTYYDNYFEGCYPDSYDYMKEGMFGVSSGLTCLGNGYYYGVRASGQNHGVISRSGANTTYVGFSSGVVQNYDLSFIVAQPFIYLDMSAYFFTENNGTYTLSKGAMSAGLNATDISYMNISRKVIDSMVAKFNCVAKLESLKDGQRVYIGDILFTNVGSGSSALLVSEPIANASLVQSLKAQKSGDEATAAVARLFTGQSITYSGMSSSLVDYIVSGDIGTWLESNTVNKGVLCRDGSVVGVMNNGTLNTDLSTSASHACVSVKFQDGLLVQPVSSDGSTYRLLTICGISGNDYVGNLPFFSESLSFGRGKNDSISLGSTLNATLQFFKECRDNFKAMMNSAFNGDVQNIIWSLIFSFVSYLCVMCWILYAILKYDIGRRYLRILSAPASGGYGYRRSRGIDLIKVVSLGIYDINTEPTLARTMIVSFICFFIMYSIINWIPH